MGRMAGLQAGGIALPQNVVSSTPLARPDREVLRKDILAE
jgi:hypothetical protein